MRGNARFKSLPAHALCWGFVVGGFGVALVGHARANPDAGSVVDSGSTTDALGIDAAPAGSAADLRARLAALTARRDALQTLLAGSLPEDLYTTELFAIDLRDEPTVERRRRELATSLGDAGPGPVVPNDAGPDAPVLDAVPPDAAVATPDAATTPTDAVANDDAAAPAFDGALPEGEEIAALQQAIEVRRVEIDRLRLAFLELPIDRRASVLAAEEVARRNAIERAAANEERERAEQEQRRAEQAQQAALEQADQSREAMQRLLANERARIEGARASLAQRRVQLSEQRAKRSADASAAHALGFSLTETARTVTSGADADALYDRVVVEVVAARDRLSASLDRLDEIEPPAPFALSATIEGSHDPALVEGRRELREHVVELDTLSKQLVADRRAMESQLAQAEAREAEALNDVRIRLLNQLSADKRERTLGFGEEGRDQLRRELEHLTLLARWTWRSKLPQLGVAVRSLQDWNTLLQVLARLIGIILLVLIARWLVARGRRRLSSLPRLISRTIRRPIWSRLAFLVVGVASAVWSPLCVVAVIWFAGKIAAPGMTSALVAVPYGLVLAFSLYRLIVVATVQSIRRLQGKRTVWNAALHKRVLRSVQLVGRLVFAFYVLSHVSSAILGRGYLFHLMIRVATLCALPLSLILFNRWRSDIVDAYLKRRRDGALARVVARSRERWYGFFVALAAFLLVLVQWVVNGARRFALSFDQTRKALAYLFRRRLERKSGDAGVQPPLELPPEVAAGLAPYAPTTDRTFAPWFPKLDEFRADVATWKAEPRRIGSWMVVGRTGMGKTTWLGGAKVAADLPALEIELAVRLTEPTELLQKFGRQLELEASDEDAVVAALRGGPQRLIVIDDVQRLALRGVGQLAVWALLCRLVDRTQDHVYWLGACSYYADEFLRWVRRGPTTFRGRTVLDPWSEPQIQALLEARLVSTGWGVSYDDLMAHVVDPVQRAGAIANTAREYARLIWDYAEGSPRAALDCWARSLVPGRGNKLRVRLFSRPPERELELLDEVSRLVLAALVWHEQLSIDHAVIALRFSYAQCNLAFRQLHGAGVIECGEEGEYSVSIAWWPAVTRYLSRKHLIET